MTSSWRRPALIWDIDGTLIEARGIGRQALNQAFADVFHVESAFSELDFAGATDYDLFAQAVHHCGLETTSATPEMFFARYIRRLRQLMTTSAPRPLPGVIAMTAQLSQAGWRMTLGTGNIRAGAYCKLAAAGIANYFPHGGFSRPGLSRAAILKDAQGTKGPSGAIVIGDTPRDIEAAHHIGAAVIAVATGRFSVQDLETRGADAVLATLEDTNAFKSAVADIVGRKNLQTSETF